MTNHEQPAAGVALSSGERAFTAWAATSGADGTPLMWVWSEMPEQQRNRWEAIAAAARQAPTDAGGAVSEALRTDLQDRLKLAKHLKAEATFELDQAQIETVLAALSSPQPLQQGGEVTRDGVAELAALIDRLEVGTAKEQAIAGKLRAILALFASPDLGDLAGLVENLEERRSRMTEVSAGMLVNPDGPEAARALRSLAADRDKAVGLLRDAAAHLPTTGPLGDRLSAFLSSQTERI